MGTELGRALAATLGLRDAMRVGELIGFLPFIPAPTSPIGALRNVPAAARAAA